MITIASIVAALMSSGVGANTQAYPLTIEDKIASLIVSPYEHSNPWLNKSLVFRASPPGLGCKFSASGHYVFSDLEGGEIRLPSESRFPSPKQSRLMSGSIYTKDVMQAMAEMKEKHCVDVSLAPIIDLDYNERSYFYRYHDKEGEPLATPKLMAERINRYVQATKNHGISVTLKHYPFSSYKVNTTLSKRQRNAILKFGKLSEALSLGYQEVGMRHPLTTDERMAIDDALKPTYKSLMSRDLIMLENGISPKSLTPYVASRSLTQDPWLRKFPGLVITDDLYQLNLENVDVERVFINADLYLMSSIEDIKYFGQRLSRAIRQKPELIQVLNNKVERVLMLYPIKPKLPNNQTNNKG